MLFTVSKFEEYSINSIPDHSRVYCPLCHKALNKNIKVCPKDSAPLNGYKYWFWSRSRPEPRMAYSADTYLIKKDGNFVWFPYEVDLVD